MKIATLIGGNHVLSLKIGAVIFSVLILFAGFKVGELYFNRRTALVFVLILETAPFFSIGSIFWSIDQPFLLFWLLGLYFVGRYIYTGNVNWFFPFGLAAGLGGLSKYTMVLLPVCLAVWCLGNRSHRRLLLQWKLYVAALLALLIVAPNIYWNIQHQFQSIGFAVGKGLTGGYSLYSFVAFIGAHFFVLSILYTVYFWISLGRKKLLSSELYHPGHAGDVGSLLLITGLLPVVFFAAASFFGEYTDPSWVNMSYFSLFLLLARYIEMEIARGRQLGQTVLFGFGMAINLVLVVVILLHLLLNFFSISGKDWTFKLIGWPDTSTQISRLFEKNGIPIPGYVVSREYQLASALALYMDNQPIPHSLEKPGRNQWSPVADIVDSGAILVCRLEECEDALEDSAERFHRPIRFLGRTVLSAYDVKVRELKVYYLEGRKK